MQSKDVSAFVVLNGQITDITLTKGAVTDITVTAGSTVLTLADQSTKPWFKVVESAKPGRFVGLESWKKSLPPKNVIIGFTQKGRTLDEVLVTDSPLTTDSDSRQPIPSPQSKPPSQDVGLQSSLIEGKPYIYVLGPPVLNGTEPIRIVGRGFRPDARMPAEVLVDGRVVRQGLTVSPEGTFVENLRLTLKVGAHTLLVTQPQGAQQALRSGAIFFIGSNDGMPKPAGNRPHTPVDQKEEKPSDRIIVIPSMVLPTLLTAADLIDAATVSGGKIQLVSMASAKSPEAKSLDWSGISSGDQLTLRFDLPAQLSVGLFASFLFGPQGGSLRVLVNGQEIGELVQLTSSSESTGKIQLGKVDFRQGTNTVTLVFRSEKVTRVSLLGLSLEK